MKRYLDKPPDAARTAQVLCACMAFSLLLMGLLSAPPAALIAGMRAIFASRSVLLSDYFIIGGVGAAFFNAGLVTLTSMGLVALTQTPWSGKLIAALFLTPGFALFGKNALNVLPFFLGVLLYARFTHTPMREHIFAALYCTTLAPIVSELWCVPALPLLLRLLLGVLAGTAIGFVIVPLAGHLGRVHKGHMLFNYGFACGFIVYLAMALVRASGGTVLTASYWTQGVPEGVLLYVLLICAGLLLFGLWLSGWRVRPLGVIFNMTGCAPDNDAVAAAGIGPAMVNMGIVGLVSLGYILLIGGDLSGPVVGAIFTAMGFAASGVHLKNFLPVMAGVLLFSLWGAYPSASPTVQLAAVFGAVALAPIAGDFGLLAGVIAGLLHYATVCVTGAPTGGLNLYNNGFAAGIVATLMLVFIEAFSLSRSAPGKRLKAALRDKLCGTKKQAAPPEDPGEPEEAAKKPA